MGTLTLHCPQWKTQGAGPLQKPGKQITSNAGTLPYASAWGSLCAQNALLLHIARDV